MQRRFASVLALVCGVSAAAGLGCSARSESVSQTTQGLDGPTIFRGVYFREGPAADLLKDPRAQSAAAPPAEKPATPALAASSLRDLATQMRADNLPTTATNLEAIATEIEAGRLAPQTATVKRREATLAMVVARIEKLDPVFFKRFGADMKSGAHVKVSRALKEGGLRLAAVGAALASARPKGATTASSLRIKDEGADPGGADPAGNYDPGGSYDNGGGAADNSGSGAADNSGSGAADNSGSGAADNSGSGNSGSGADGPVDTASLVRVQDVVFYNRFVNVDQAVNIQTLYNIGANPDDGSLATAAWVNHLTLTLSP